jgi:hypothetical protein
MEKTWKISGCYANWTLTLTVAPPSDPEDFDVPEWPGDKFEPVADHFKDAVNFYEVSRDAQRLYRTI